jgi:subtilisin family serine protease
MGSSGTSPRTDGAGRRGVRRVAVAGLVSAIALVVALSAGLPATSAPQLAGRPGTSYVADQLLVRFASGASDARVSEINAAVGTTTLRSFHIMPNLRLVQVRNGLSASEAIARYQTFADVMYAEPNYTSHISETIPNDPSFNLQYNWKNTGQSGGTVDADVDATDAWDHTTGSSSVIIGLIDTGVQIDPHLHVDLAANAWQNTAECNGVPGVDDDNNGYVDDCYGIDTINHDSDPNDDYNHGTHVAGIMGAVGNNSLGVTGLNWNVKILPCKSHDNTGNGTNASLIECLQYMLDQKARGQDIVATNNSYGGCKEACGFSQSLHDAIEAHMDAGILYVAAAGNNSSDNDLTPLYPADYWLPNVIAVAATDDADGIAFYSDWGVRTVSLGAPGDSIYSTLFTDGYGYDSGTSMASPHVAALVALLHASNPTLDWRAIRNLILAGGDIEPAMTGKTFTSRRMNANGSLTCTNTAVFAPLRPLETISGGEQTVAVLNILCEAPAGGLSVTITPGNKTVVLRDNGRNADLANRDGIYSGTWTPCADGTYTLSFSNGQTSTTTVAGATPCIKLSPAFGPGGTTTTVSGTGFGANETVTLTFDRTTVGSASTDSNGSFSTAITVPLTATRGFHPVKATGQTSGSVGQAGFKVTA